MVLKFVLALAGLFTVLSFSFTAFALDQLPLPDARNSIRQADIIEFVSAEPQKVQHDPCASLLQTPLETQNGKIQAIKAYRHCRADYTLQQLAVWQFREDFN